MRVEEEESRGWTGALRSGARSFGIEIGEKEIAAFETFRALLVDWNRRVNLTAITGDEDVAARHFVDSLACMQAREVPRGARVLDVGSGAGFPGIPLAIVRPDLEVWLLDSTRKKVDFLREACRVLGLKAQAVWGRAEDAARLPEFRERFDVVAARAVAALPVLVEYCLPFCRVGGWFLAMKGPEAESEVVAASGAIAVLGGVVGRVLQYELPCGAGRRSIVTVAKVAATPAAYPRKAGIPEKRPLSKWAAGRCE